jgi:hypothetical protein
MTRSVMSAPYLVAMFIYKTMLLEDDPLYDIFLQQMFEVTTR